MAVRMVELVRSKNGEFVARKGSRSAVKAWMVATFGNSKPIRRWPPKMLSVRPTAKTTRRTHSGRWMFGRIFGFGRAIAYCGWSCYAALTV
jgi:hypothetical protein